MATDYERGDFLIRGLIGADEETGAVTVGARVRPGQTVRLQVRDAESAHDDLVRALRRQLAVLGRPPAGSLLFTCNGRGSHMFGTAGHDAQAVADAFVEAPTAGFFCAGEMGPSATTTTCTASPRRSPYFLAERRLAVA